MSSRERARYVSLEEVIESILKELGGSASVEEVLLEAWRRYGRGGSERVVMRLYKTPTGSVWSPEAEEALRVLEEAGVISRAGDKLYLLAGKRVDSAPRV